MNYCQSCPSAFGVSPVTPVVSEHHPTHSKGQYSLVFSSAGITNGFMRHKLLLENLFPGSCLSRDSDDTHCKTDYPTVEKLKSSTFSLLTITYFVVFVCHDMP